MDFSKRPIPAHNIMFGFPNRIDQALLSGGGWVAGLPLANVQDRLLSKVARSIDTSEAATQFALDLVTAKPIRALALIAHNSTFQGRVRIEASHAADFSTLFMDTGWRDIWGGLIGAPWLIDELEWESENYWYGTYSREEVEGFTATSVQLLPGPAFARFFRVSIRDVNNPAGFFEVGRVFIGEVAQPRVNYSWGGSLGYEIGTTVETALGGAEFSDEREPLRIMRMTLDHLDDAAGFGTFLELVRRAGVSREVLVIPNPADELQGLRRNFIGRIRQPSPLEQVGWLNGGSSHSISYEIKELR